MESTVSKNEKLFLGFAFILTAILSLLPFFHVGFTTSDDVQYYVTAHRSWDYWIMDHQAYAQGQGRFYFLITKFFYYVPYLCGSFLNVKIVQYVSLIACYCLFSYIVYRIFRCKWLAALTLLFLVFDTAVTAMGYFIAITAYPFFFSFSFMLFLTGVLTFINYYERGGKWRPIVAAVLFFLSALFYENYLVFILLVGIYIFVRHWRRDGFVKLWRNRDFYREVLPVAVVMIVYVGCYLGYRRWVATTVPEAAFYSGAAISSEGFSLGNFFRLLRRCTFITLPGQPYFYSKTYVSENSLLLGGHRNNPLFILTHASAIVVVNALLQTVILWVLTRRRWFDKISWRKIGLGVALALVFAFSANVLIAVTPKYNQDWAVWLKGYVTSFYCYFGVMLAFALIVVATLKLCRRHGTNTFVRVLWCVLFFFFAVLTGYSNEHLSREWQKSQNRFRVLDFMGKEGYFDTLQDGAILYTEELHKTSKTGYSICIGTEDIGNYIDILTSNQFKEAIDINSLCSYLDENPDATVYYLHACETKKAAELLVAVSPVTCTRSADTIVFHAAKSDLFYLSPTKDYTVIYKDGELLKSVEVQEPRRHTKVSRYTISGDSLDPSGIIISNMPFTRERLDY